MAFAPTFSAKGVAVHPDGTRAVTRTLPEEVPVAFVFDGTTQAVMMATPADIEDFAVGFALSEGIVVHAGEITETEVVAHGPGIEARMWLTGDRAEALAVEAAEIMETRRISQLLVTNRDGRLIGALNHHDLMLAKVI